MVDKMKKEDFIKRITERVEKGEITEATGKAIILLCLGDDGSRTRAPTLADVTTVGERFIIHEDVSEVIYLDEKGIFLESDTRRWWIDQAEFVDIPIQWVCQCRFIGDIPEGGIYSYSTRTRKRTKKKNEQQNTRVFYWHNETGADQ